MEVKKINIDTIQPEDESFRPDTFENFIGQEHIKSVLHTAMESAETRNSTMWHILFSGPSGFGKTTMAHIISKHNHVSMKTVTGYAITKPAEIVSILNNLDECDILFIDEIHRLRPNVEEVLYIAMEDFVIDMVMPEWGNVRIPINKFTLIWATTKPEALSKPMKNRFVYDFHFMDYNVDEKKQILKKYLEKYWVPVKDELLDEIQKKVDSVPREIHNLCIKIRDFFVTKYNWKNEFTGEMWKDFLKHSKISDWWMTPLHEKYLNILREANRPLGLKSIAIQLWMTEKWVEEDIEPLLLKMWKIDKTTQWRILTWENWYGLFS